VQIWANFCEPALGRYIGGMEHHGDEPEIGRKEWNDPNNWFGFGPWKIYVSRRDPRISVPRWWDNLFSPRTINFGHRLGVLYASLIFYMFVGMIVFIAWLQRHR
jgi:hypothetical protein